MPIILTDPRRDLLDIFDKALQAVNGRTRVRDYLSVHLPVKPVHIIAIGKAACAMTLGAHDALGANIRDALVITKEGHTELLPWPVMESGHPMPDERSLFAGAALLRFVAALPRDAQVLVLLSGGASALVECLPQDMNLAQLRRITDWLLGSGLDIGAMNWIRKRLSLIKGGRLAQLLAPRSVICLAISDVPGNDPRAIGSGPLVPDSNSEYPFTQKLPDFVDAPLNAASPIPRADDPCFSCVHVEIVACLEDAKIAAAAAAHDIGYAVEIVSEFIAGEAAEMGTRLACNLRGGKVGVVQVWGGETTVRLPPSPGRGGRNQSLALAAATEFAGLYGSYLLSAGTDGTDGPTSDAGALVDGNTVARGETQGLDVYVALSRADAGTFLEASGDLIHTGPTGTNVMDLMLGLKSV